MRQRLKRGGLVAALLLALLLAAGAANTWRQWAGLSAAADSPAARSRSAGNASSGVGSGNTPPSPSSHARP